jgi:lactate dehydrogenase-like 2-hydroxyacid dehydrogenase
MELLRDECSRTNRSVAGPRRLRRLTESRTAPGSEGRVETTPLTDADDNDIEATFRVMSGRPRIVGSPTRSEFRTFPMQATSTIDTQTRDMGVGTTLRGKTIGLYGYGRIARVVADYA